MSSDSDAYGESSTTLDDLPGNLYHWRKLLLFCTLLSIGMAGCLTPESKLEPGSFVLDDSLRLLLVRAESDFWTGEKDLDSWHAGLLNNGIQLERSQLQRVVLEEEYFTTKSFDSPEEILFYRFQDNVLFVRVETRSQ